MCLGVSPSSDFFRCVVCLLRSLVHPHLRHHFEMLCIHIFPTEPPVDRSGGLCTSTADTLRRHLPCADPSCGPRVDACPPQRLWAPVKRRKRRGSRRGGKMRRRGQGARKSIDACWSRVATFVARDNPNYRSQLDYICANAAALPTVKDCQVHWDATLQRHGEHYDHAAVEARVEIRVARRKRRKQVID